MTHNGVARWRRWMGGCVAVCLAAGAAIAQPPPLPDNDPAAWLEEASVQARRVSGVGGELTTALQTKGELLTFIGVQQTRLGETAAGERNLQLANLCVRALAHDGEAGWVRTARVRAELESESSGDGQVWLEKIENQHEREAAERMATLGPGAIDRTTRDGVTARFADQLNRVEAHEWLRSNARTVARTGGLADVRAWVEVLDDPAERAWACLGVAEGLREKALQPPRVEVMVKEPEPEPALEPQTRPVPEVKAPGVAAVEPGAEAEVEAVAEVVVEEDATAAEVNDVEVNVAEDVAEAESVALNAAGLGEAEAAMSIPSAESVGRGVAVKPNAEPAVETQIDAVVDPEPQAVDVETESGIAEPPTQDQTEGSGLAEAEVESESSAEAAMLVESPSIPSDGEDVVVPVAPVVAGEPVIAVTQIPVVPDLTRLANPDAVLNDAPAAATYDLLFITTKGGFTVRVHRAWAPRAADRFYDLATAGFYQNQRFFRVVPGFVVQWGIHGYPEVAKAWRSQLFPDEPRTQSNRRGTFAFAAATTPNTRTTQVFINLDDNAFLDDLGFVPFGEIVEGLDVVESLFGGYGETPSTRQRDIQLQGNAFLDKQYPELDSIISVEIAPDQ